MGKKRESISPKHEQWFVRNKDPSLWKNGGQIKTGYNYIFVIVGDRGDMQKYIQEYRKQFVSQKMGSRENSRKI